MIKKPIVPFFTAAAIACALLASGCAFEHSSGGTGPAAATSTSTATPLVGTWASQAVVPSSSSSCGSFQWNVTSQTSTSVTGTFTAQCGGNVSLTGSGSGQLTTATTVAVNASGTGNIPGNASCAFTLTGTGTVLDNGNTLEIPYTGTTCLGPVHGTETLRKNPPATPAPPVTPAPTPTPSPAPSGSVDAIDLTQAVILNSPSDVARWPATATITLLDLGANGVHIEFTKQNSWPDYLPPGWDGSLQYTLWIVLNINGRWYASGCIEYWRGLDRSGGPPSGYAQDWYYDPIRWAPMSGHQPAPGEQVGFLVTAGDARNNGGTLLKERSNVVMVPFPGNGGASFSFSLSSRGLSIGR